MKARGYSWDSAISPTLQLAPEDCPDGYCPVEPNEPFGMLQGLWSSGTPCDVGISDAGGALTLTCEVMNFNVNQNLEEVVSADVTLKPTQSSTGGGMNVGGGT